MHVARGDVVRVRATGEVGTVVGWAEHERLGGGRIDVRMSRSDSRTFAPGSLEFVTDAKFAPTGGRLVAWWVVFVVTGLWAGWTAWRSSVDYEVSVSMAVFIGFATWHFVFVFLRNVLVKPRKMRVR